MRILSDGGIRWSWYMHLTTHKDGTCTVEREYRLHCERDHGRHPTAVGGYNVKEKEGKREPGETFPPRFATAIMVETYNGDKVRRRTYPLRGGPVPRFSFPE